MAVFFNILFTLNFMLSLQFQCVSSSYNHWKTKRLNDFLQNMERFKNSNSKLTDRRMKDVSKIELQHMENDPEREDKAGFVVQMETQRDRILKDLSSESERNTDFIKNLKDWFAEFIIELKAEGIKYSETVRKSKVQLAEFAKSIQADHDNRTRTVKELRDQFMKDSIFVKNLNVNLDRNTKTAKELTSQLIRDAKDVKKLKRQLIRDAEDITGLKKQLIRDAEDSKGLKDQLIHDTLIVKELKHQLTIDTETVKKLKSQIINDGKFVNELKTECDVNAKIVSNLGSQLTKNVDQVKHLKTQSERDTKTNRHLKLLQADKKLKVLASKNEKDVRLRAQYGKETTKKLKHNVTEVNGFIQGLVKQQTRPDSEFMDITVKPDYKTKCKLIHCDYIKVIGTVKALENNSQTVIDTLKLLYAQQIRNSQKISKMAKRIIQLQKENRRNTVVLGSHDHWLKRILYDKKHEAVQKPGLNISAGNISESDFERQKAHSMKRNTDTVPSTAIAFYAYMFDHTLSNPSPGQTVRFDRVVTNAGDSYNKDSGVFTCKIGGIYVFSWTIDAITEMLFKTCLVKNGHTIGYVESGYSNHPTTGSNTVIVYLDVGDNVWIKVLDGGAGHIDSFESTFSGFLLK